MKLFGIAAIIASVALAWYLMWYIPQKDKVIKETLSIPHITQSATPTNIPTDTPTPIPVQQVQKNNVFTCSDPTNGEYAPCVVSNVLNGTCEDTSNGEAFPCVNAPRISDTYPPHIGAPAPGFNFGKQL